MYSRTSLLRTLFSGTIFLVSSSLPRRKFINHKDGNPSNEHGDNLEYVTVFEKLVHSYGLGRGHGVTASSVAVWGKREEAIEWICYAAMAAGALDSHRAAISACCRGKAKQTWDCVFQYDRDGVVASYPGEEWRDAVLPPRLGGTAARPERNPRGTG